MLCRALGKGYADVCLYTTDLTADASWVVEKYAQRNTIETVFKTSKQIMKIEEPQHWCKESIQKLAPWVFFSQSLVMLWYLSSGRHLPEAETARKELGPWESEWSYRSMFRLLRRLTIRHTINIISSKNDDMLQLIQSLENYLYLAA